MMSSFFHIPVVPALFVATSAVGGGDRAVDTLADLVLNSFFCNIAISVSGVKQGCIHSKPATLFVRFPVDAKMKLTC